MYENTIVNYVYSYSVSSSLIDDHWNINLLCCFGFPPLPVVTSYFMYNRKIKYNCKTAVLRAVQVITQVRVTCIITNRVTHVILFLKHKQAA